MQSSRSLRCVLRAAVLAIAIAPLARAADPEPPVQLSSQADHDRLAKLLGVTDIRPGAAGRDRTDPNWAPYDEAKANTYASLPDPLITNDGRKVTSADMWWNVRRPEIVEMFDREMYGRMPANVPKVTWEVVSISNGQTGNVPTLIKQIRGHVDNSSYPLIDVNIQLTLTVPANAVGPVPVMMVFGGGGGGGAAPGRGGRAGAPGAPGAAAVPGAPAAAGAGAAPGAADGAPARGGRGLGAGAAPGRGGAAPAGRGGGFGGGGGPGTAEQILVRGWGYATLAPGSIQADNGAGLTQGIIGLVNKGQPRKPDDWGALRAWAWGVSRALDYFETDPQVNAKMVGLEGHSRYGKGTIVAMAYEPRLAIAFPSSSGSGGAHINRRRYGEKVENVGGTSEYHWMAGNFIKYTGTVNGKVLTADDIPVDGHQLVAMCAPRPVFISGGIQQLDAWQDPKGMFMAGLYASPVYELLGAKGIGAKEYPKPMTFVSSGEIAFREHELGHVDGPNWPYFLEWASRYIKLAPDLSSNLTPVPQKTPPDGVFWEIQAARDASDNAGAAMTTATGRRNYIVERSTFLRLLAACTVILAMQATVNGQEVGPAQPWSKYKVHDMDRPKPPVVAPATAPSEPLKAPSDAVVLFDGKDLSGWESENGGRPATWTVADGAITVGGRGGIRTKEKFGDVQLHIEWATPTPARGTSQGRGNSGVFLMGLFEIQVLDNYNADTYPDGQAGAVYGQYPPLVNASRPPGEWQTYDIIFAKPLYKDGKLDRPARVTVIHNGVVVQANTAVFGPTVHLQVAKYPEQPMPETGPLLLQNHNNPVKFRNIWIRPLEKLQVQQEGKQ